MNTTVKIIIAAKKLYVVKASEIINVKNAKNDEIKDDLVVLYKN